MHYVHLVPQYYELAALLYEMTLKRVAHFVPQPQMAQTGHGSLLVSILGAIREQEEEECQ